MVFAMPGCDSAEGADASAGASGSTESSDDNKSEYEKYIKSAIESVNGDATPVPEADTKPGQAVTVDRSAGNDFYVSSMEDDLPFVTPVPDADLSPSPTEDPNATPTPEPTPYITPEEFDVGKCCIYINGESDSAYGTEIITAINKARTDLGYKPLITNKGLSTCADRRTREIAANFSHTRPNGEFFTSLAPEHFRAEMLVIDNQKAESTVDALIKEDPISRNLIFTEKYQSIGASSFKCNGMRYSVVSFGL